MGTVLMVEKHTSWIKHMSTNGAESMTDYGVEELEMARAEFWLRHKARTAQRVTVERVDAQMLRVGLDNIAEVRVKEFEFVGDQVDIDRLAASVAEVAGQLVVA